MKKRWIVIVAGVIGAVSMMATPAPKSRFKTESQVCKTTYLDTVPGKKKDTTTYPHRRDSLNLSQR